MIHWYYLVKEPCRSSRKGSASKNSDSRITAFGGDKHAPQIDRKTRQLWLLAGLAEIAPFFAGCVTFVFVEGALISWSGMVAGIVGTALVIAVLCRKVPPPPIEATKGTLR